MLSDDQFEIDYHAVGNGERSGDAISMRYGLNGGTVIHVVDGGTVESGQSMVGHVNRYYDNPSFIDHVVLTHVDDDHSSGLREIFKNFEVGALWMNRPWLYADQLLTSFSGNWSIDGLRRHLKRQYPIISELEELANQDGTPIYETFRGTMIGRFAVLSPTREFYLRLIPNFSRTPEASGATAQQTGPTGRILRDILDEARKWVEETLHFETLSDDPGPTSATNESSVVQYGIVDNKAILLTGDAGIEALSGAANYLITKGLAPKVDFIQVPHHGSRHNITPTLLNQFIGPPTAWDVTQPKVASAIASASSGDSDHPRRVVTNAFRRRGAPVCATNGKGIRDSINMPARPGWNPVTPLEFFGRVETESV